MAKVTEWFFYYFLIFKLFRVAKLKFPTFPQSKSIANCSEENPEENQQKVAKSADFNCIPINQSPHENCQEDYFYVGKLIG